MFDWQAQAAVLVLAHLLATFLIWRQARTLGWSEELALDLVVVATLSILVGGRLYYVFEHTETFVPNLLRVILIPKYPGFSLMGGVIASLFSLALVARVRRLHILTVLDFFSLPVLVFSIIVLLGCRLSLCLEVDANYILPATLLLFLSWVFLLHLRQFLLDSWQLAKIRHSSGLTFLLSVVAFELVLLLLAKNKTGVLYFYRFLLPAEFLLGVYWYRELIFMIKLPASVLGQIKDYLEKKRRDIEGRMIQLRRDDPTTDKDRLHQESSDDDTATAKAKHERVQAMQLQLTKSLVEIRKALAKIKVGSYGICGVCGRMIDTDRLAANPSATLCLEDERKREKGKK